MTSRPTARRSTPTRRPELVDAADRLLLDESASARADLPHGTLVVIGDVTGGLTLGSADGGARGIRVHQDPLTAERALEGRARERGQADDFTSHGLEPELVEGARLVLLRLPRSLDALRDIAGLIAAHAHPEVVVFAGGRIKHMTTTMNDVLREVFGRVDVTHARQKSRVLVARQPSGGGVPQARTEDHPGLLTVRALGGVFADTSIDIGTRFLLEHLPDELPEEVIDLACGTGVVATVLALRHPELISRLMVVDTSPTHNEATAHFAELVSAMRNLDVTNITSRSEADRQLARFVPDPAVRGFLLQNLRRHSGHWSWNANLDLLGDNLHVVSGWPTLDASWDGPTWWVVGGRSDYVKESDMPAMRKLFPRVVSVTLKRAGHWVHADEPQAFTEILRTFLA